MYHYLHKYDYMWYCMYLVSLYKRFFHIVLWVHIQDIIVNFGIRHLLMIHCPYRSGKNISWNFSNISFKEGGSYNLRSNTSCRHGLCWCWPGLTVEHSSFSYQEYPECSGFQAGAKDLFISFGICPMNQSVYSECGVFVFIFSKCTVCFVLVFVSFN